MGQNLIFTPGASASLSCSQASANVAIPSGAGTVLRLINDGTSTVFFKAGASAVTAATTDTPLYAGATELFQLDAGATTLAGICGTGNTTTLRITRGQGY